jgi:hypothetical protein
MADDDGEGRRSSRRGKRRLPSDGLIYRRALGIGAIGVFVVLAGIVFPKSPVGRAVAMVPSMAQKLIKKPEEEKKHLWPVALDEELRKKGYHECLPPDPIGLGPYKPFRNVSGGRLTIPQKGGHTDDFGYDVIVHFHGASPVRKTLVQVARGVAYVGIDRGIGSGVYSNAFENPETWKQLVRSIESALKKESGDERAHIRHIGLSAWSAGYGAVNEILKYDADGVDAVILLDGLHAGWNPKASQKKQNAESCVPGAIEPTFKYARRALAGEKDKLFVFTHSHVNPEKYPSTEATADLMLKELSLTRTDIDPKGDKFGQVGTVDVKGFHLWSYQGTNEYAHCTHINYITQALHAVEDAWGTPSMDRDVPHTPAPDKIPWKVGAEGAGEGEIEMELVPTAAGGDAGAAAPAEGDPAAAVTNEGLATALTADVPVDNAPATPAPTNTPPPPAAAVVPVAPAERPNLTE